MAEGKNLKATSDAADLMRAVRSYDHGAPSSEEVAQVSGVKVGPAQSYTEELGSVGRQLGSEFQRLMALVTLDFDRSQQSIEQMQELDDEISGALDSLSLEAGVAAPLPNGNALNDKNTWG